MGKNKQQKKKQKRLQMLQETEQQTQVQPLLQSNPVQIPIQITNEPVIPPAPLFQSKFWQPQLAYRYPRDMVSQLFFHFSMNRLNFYRQLQDYQDVENSNQLELNTTPQETFTIQNQEQEQPELITAVSDSTEPQIPENAQFDLQLQTPQNQNPESTQIVVKMPQFHEQSTACNVVEDSIADQGHIEQNLTFDVSEEAITGNKQEIQNQEEDSQNDKLILEQSIPLQATASNSYLLTPETTILNDMTQAPIDLVPQSQEDLQELINSIKEAKKIEQMLLAQKSSALLSLHSVNLKLAANQTQLFQVRQDLARETAALSTLGIHCV